LTNGFAITNAITNLIDDAKSTRREMESRGVRANSIGVCAVKSEVTFVVHVTGLGEGGGAKFHFRRPGQAPPRPSAPWRLDPGVIAEAERPVDPGSSLRFGRDDNFENQKTSHAEPVRRRRAEAWHAREPTLLRNRNARPEGRALVETVAR